MGPTARLDSFSVPFSRNSRRTQLPGQQRFPYQGRRLRAKIPKHLCCLAGTKNPSGKRARPVTPAPRTNDARRRDFVGLPLGVRTGLQRLAPNSGIWGKLTRIAESGKSFVAESAAQRPGAGGAPRRRGRCCPARGFVGVAGSRYRAYTRKAPAVLGVGSFRRLVVIVDASGGVAARPGSPSGAQKPSFFGIPFREIWVCRDSHSPSPLFSV